MKKERDLARVQAVCTSGKSFRYGNVMATVYFWRCNCHIDRNKHLTGDKGFELKMLQEKHREEVAEMKKRLQWYAENQELLDKDASRLRAATAETQRLTEQVEKLKMEVSRKANEQQRKAKERAGEAKRIQDLERQVRHNFLPLHIFLLPCSAGTSHSGHVLFCALFPESWNYPTVSVSNRPSVWIVSFPTTFSLPPPLHVKFLSLTDCTLIN